MQVHFIAIGGAVMHNLALALAKKGYQVSGSDDEIFDPAKSRLMAAGILPEKEGWFPEKITANIDAVILGMHARDDNPELLKARQFGLKTYSFPEYIYEQSKDKQRVVIAGSHGKTTITSMVMYVLKYHHKDFDYMVGANIEGFDLMVKLTSSAPYIILEGDEYLASALQKVPKFLFYKPHIALISGIAWDHFNVFPTFENYLVQFKKFTESIEPGGTLIYYGQDAHLKKIVEELRDNIEKVAYEAPAYRIDEGVAYVSGDEGEFKLKIFGRHNLENMEGARLICKKLGVGDKDFYEAIQHFKGAAKRLELLAQNEETVVYKDFAHSPSKVQATVGALKSLYPQRKLTSCLELHTYSSLNKEFIGQYANSMNDADAAIVYYNPHTLEMKRLPALTPAEIANAFSKEGLKVFTNSAEMEDYLKCLDWHNQNLLLMSSGNFDGLNMNKLANFVISHNQTL